MKTDELITVLAAGTAPVPAGVARRRLLIACLIGALATAVLVYTLLPARDDLAFAVQTRPFWMKLGYTVWLAIGGYLLAERAARPGAKPGAGTYVAAAGLAAIGAMAVFDLTITPMAGWHALWMGQSAMFCPWAILVASVPIFIAVIVVMRRLAPTRLRFAGAAAGFLAGGVGAAVYATWCREHSALFVASWYTLGIAACAGIGALLGPRLLRW